MRQQATPKFTVEMPAVTFILLPFKIKLIYQIRILQYVSALLREHQFFADLINHEYLLRRQNNQKNNFFFFILFILSCFASVKKVKMFYFFQKNFKT